MSCHVCNAVNSAMSVRCTNCHTVLIPEALPRSQAAQQGENALNSYMAEGYGALAGFAVASASWMVFSGQDDDVGGFIMVGVIAGGVLGRIVSRLRRSR